MECGGEHSAESASAEKSGLNLLAPHYGKINVHMISAYLTSLVLAVKKQTTGIVSCSYCSARHNQPSARMRNACKGVWIQGKFQTCESNNVQTKIATLPKMSGSCFIRI